MGDGEGVVVAGPLYRSLGCGDRGVLHVVQVVCLVHTTC